MYFSVNSLLKHMDKLVSLSCGGKAVLQEEARKRHDEL